MFNAFRWLPVGRVPEIDADALWERLERGDTLHLVDVRTRREFAASRIDGAVSLPITGLRRGLDAAPLARDVPVIAICRSAHRSIPAVRVLRGLGYDAQQLAGGMLAWWRADLPCVSG